MPLVQFTPFSSLVEPAFWHALTQLKVDVLRLSSDAVPITASYNTSRSLLDKTTSQEISLAGGFSLSGDAFKKDISVPANSVATKGILKNFNTIEEFRVADKAAIFNEFAQQLWASNDPSSLTQFLLLTFADLKKYKYYYWFAFPAFVAKPAWQIGLEGWQSAAGVLGIEILDTIRQSLVYTQEFFLVRFSSSSSPHSVETAPISAYPAFFHNIPESEQLIAFMDPSAQPNNPGWPLRNLLTHLIRTNSNTPCSFRVLCWRDVENPQPNRPWKSRLGVVRFPSLPSFSGDNERWTAVGWEKDTRGKMAPRVADLSSMMDPQRLADQATALNLKLMRWRILPSLDLERIANTKCLLLGAGTLGCYVARVLMGWGVKKITFVDSARVSFSNPVRQPLFEFEDCLDGGKEKAICAAERLAKIWPGVDAQGVHLSIPMPGHPIPDDERFITQARSDVNKLERLFDEHDVIYLLMDSRESRWLPTVLGASKGKIVLNAALGFDTYLVMRHGPRPSSIPQSDAARLGCYYCNDIVAPADSLKDRTLDQMCTVTRPGLAPIAASTAVELMVSLVQHPAGVNAPSPPDIAPHQRTSWEDTAGPGTGILGLIPHQLRGFLAQFRTLLITGAAYHKCTACSEIVLKVYEEEGFEFLLRAFNDSKYLEKLTGLDKLYDEGEAALEQVDWDEEDEEDV